MNKIGFYVGLLALLLAIPLSVVANMLTPKVATWYSFNSRRRVDKRIRKLEKRLRECEDSWVFNDGEYWVFQFVSTGILAAAYGIQILLTVFLALLTSFKNQIIQYGLPHSYSQLRWMLFFSALLFGSITFLLLFMTLQAGRWHTSFGIAARQNELDRLRELIGGLD